jgi:hypothetical protein
MGMQGSFIRPPRAVIAAVGLLLLVTVVACNYRFGGYREGQTGIRTLNIPPFQNRTRQVGIEAEFTNDLVYEVGRGDRIDLATPQAADAVVYGIIKDLRTNTISRQSLNTSLERRVYVTVELIVQDRRGELLWRYELNENEAYFVQADKVSTEARLREALAAISRRIAEKFHYRFTQDF